MAQLYYSPVTVNTGQVPSTQSDFPILISYTDARFKDVAHSGHVNSSSGFDIRPYSDSALTTALTYELERYNAATGEVIMWVKRSSLADGNVTYLGYGDTSLATDGSSATTWSNGFTGVYHLKNGTTLDLTDATGNRNLTNHSATATSGKIDGAINCVAASSQHADTGLFTGGTTATISAWVNGTSFPSAYNGCVTHNNTVVASFFGFWVKSNGKLEVGAYAGGANRIYDGTGSHTLSTGTWYYIAITWRNATAPNGGLFGYVNGQLDGSVLQASTDLATGNTAFDIGKDPRNVNYFNGVIDEARITNVSRSADWIATEYNNQNAPSTFATLGTEVSLAVTRSGWFVFF